MEKFSRLLCMLNIAFKTQRNREVAIEIKIVRTVVRGSYRERGMTDRQRQASTKRALCARGHAYLRVAARINVFRSAMAPIYCCVPSLWFVGVDPHIPPPCTRSCLDNVPFPCTGIGVQPLPHANRGHLPSIPLPAGRGTKPYTINNFIVRILGQFS